MLNQRRSASIRAAAIATAGMLALTLTACQGGADTGGASGGDGELTAVSVGVIPILDVAPLYLGIEQGFFEEEGLDVTIESAQGAAAMTPAVLNQEFQFGFGNNVTLLLGAERGLDLKIVSAGATDTEQGAMAIYVRADSDIATAADLAGHTVAINALQNVGEIGVRAAVDAAGADSSQVEFVEAAFAQTASLLLDGQVDAAWVLEPFLAPVVDEVRPVVEIRSSIADPLSFASYFTSGTFAGAQPDTVAAFQRAMERSLEYAATDPDAVRAVIPTYLDVPADVIPELDLPLWEPEVDRDSLAALADVAQEYGVLTASPDIDALFAG